MVGFAVATVVVESEVVLVRYDELDEVSHDGSVSPPVLTVETDTTVGEEHGGETFVEPDVGAVPVEEVLT